MDEKINKGKIIIKKYGQEHKFENNALLLRRGAPLQGVGFEITAAEDIKDSSDNIIYKKNDLVMHSLYTDENGMVQTKELEYGKYNIYETTIVDCYKLDERYVKQIELKEKEIKVNIDSDLVLSTLKVCNNTDSAMAFSIFNDKRNLVLTSMVEAGCAISYDEMIPLGVYYYKDINNNIAKIEIKEDTNMISVDAGKKTVEVKKIPKNSCKNEFVLFKVDDLGKPLMGAVFGLIDLYGTKVCFSCSDKDGRVLFKHLKKGTYLVREVEAPEGYAESDINIIFSIDEDWVNQSKRIDCGEKFEDVYIVVADKLHTDCDKRYNPEHLCESEPEIIYAVEEITSVAGIVFNADTR